MFKETRERNSHLKVRGKRGRDFKEKKSKLSLTFARTEQWTGKEIWTMDNDLDFNSRLSGNLRNFVGPKEEKNWREKKKKNKWLDLSLVPRERHNESKNIWVTQQSLWSEKERTRENTSR